MSRLLPCTLLILFFVLCSSFAQQQSNHSDILSFSPRLKVEAIISDYIASLPPKAPDEWHNFRGLVIEETTIEGIYPLLTTVFFGTAQDTLPARYRLFHTSEQRRNFTDITIPGGTIQKYWYILNIIGYRMEKFPKTTIRLAGGYSLEPGEDRLLAGKRVMFVKDYLTTIWGISPDRIDLLPVHEPVGPQASALTDTMRQAELRSVKIESDFSEILDIVHIREHRRFLSPDIFVVHIDPLLPPEQIARYTIEIAQGENLLAIHSVRWHPDSTTLTQELDIAKLAYAKKANTLDRTTPLQFTAIITDKNGVESYSNPAFIPVKVATIPTRRTCSFSNKTINRFSLLIFPYEESTLDSQHQRMIATIIAPSIRDDARIKVTGYCDLSERDSTTQLSIARGKGVTRQLLSLLDTNQIQRISHEGVGGAQPLFSNDLPEGRCYNRTVQVVVEMPRKEQPWEE